jgi:hypothetical protein
MLSKWDTPLLVGLRTAFNAPNSDQIITQVLLSAGACAGLILLAILSDRSELSACQRVDSRADGFH